MMVSYSNQKTVTCYKEPCDKEHIYMTVNIEALESAARDLSYGGFKMFIYFAKNQDGYCFALSSKDVKERFGMAKTAYDNAIHELINKGYLVKESETANYYSFNESKKQI